MSGPKAWVGQAVEGAKSLRRRYRWIDHLVRAGVRYDHRRGNDFAAGVTYFSFLSLFPLLLLGLAVAGFVLAGRPDLLDQLKSTIADALPGTVGDNAVSAVEGAISARGTAFLVGLLGVLYAGLGWVSHLRVALQEMWNVRVERPYLKQKLYDLGVLVGLGLAAAVSVSLTIGATAASGVIVDAIGLRDNPGGAGAVHVIGLIVAVFGDALIFSWMFVRLPRRPVSHESVAKGALFAAIGFEVLKIIAGYYTRQVSQSPTAGLFGNVIGLLVWLYLVARFLLFAAAWTATDEAEPDRAEPEQDAGTGTEVEEEREESVPVARSERRGGLVAGTMVGIAALVGTATSAAGRRCRRRLRR